MKAPLGAAVRIFVDLQLEVHPADAILTQGGRLYHVVSVRRQQRGKHAGRQHLGCIVMADGVEDYDEARLRTPPEAEVHCIRWYPRGRR